MHSPSVPLACLTLSQLQGNLLFSLLEPRWPALAGKITGMLLECTAEEREELMRVPEMRERRIEEALAVLRATGGNTSGLASLEEWVAFSVVQALPSRFEPAAAARTFSISRLREAIVF